MTTTNPGWLHRRLAVVVSLSAMLFVAVAVPGEPAHAVGPGTTPLTSGQLTMISTHADGTSGLPLSGVEGANQVAVSDDGSAVAFVSDVPAQDLVTDPVQLATGVTDNNTGVGSTDKGDDVFVYQKIAGQAIISLASWNTTRTGTGNAPSTAPVMAPHGLGLVFQSGATDLVTGHVDANQKHLYAWVPGLGSLTGVFLVDTKYQTSDACNCSAEDPSISLFPPTVVFEATGGGPTNELVAPGVQGQGEDQIYAHDIVGNTNTLVSVTNDSTVPNARSATNPDIGNGAVGGASQPMIASDAPIVVFEATGDDLIHGFDSSNGSNIWEHNLITGTTTLVSASASGDPNGTSGNEDPVISAFGTTVAWDSNGTDVSSTPFSAAQQNQPLPHIYFKIVLPIASPTLMADTDWTGALACNADSHDPGLSGDGLSVVFDSGCSDITKPAALGGATPDNNNDSDVFERTFAPVPDPAPRLLSINDTGNATGNNSSQLCAPNDGNYNFPCDSLSDPSVSVNNDGTVVSYFTDATDIAGPAQGTPPFNDGSVIASYPKLLAGVKNVLVSARPDGAYPDDTAGDAVVSKDGSSVAFVSSADNLVPNDANQYFDVFESDLHDSFYIQPIAAVSEGAGSVTITVGRTGNDGTTDTVTVETGDGSIPALPTLPPEITDPAHSNAVAPGDYTATSKTLTFPPGVLTQTFSVPIIDDNLSESPELFHVALSAGTGAGSVPLPGPLSDAYVVILDNDSPQSWNASVTQQPPASAHVGDTVTVKATISVDAGADDLTVNSLTSGGATSGLDQVQFDATSPFNVPAGTTKVITATARVTGAPGAAGIKLQFSVNGTLGATTSTKTADSNAVASIEALSATLAAVPSTVLLTDQITYTLTVDNHSDTTPAQLTGLPAGLAAPAGTSFFSRVNGVTTVPPGGTSVWTLTVDVDDADANALLLTQTPGTVSYGMSAVGLASRPLTVAPASVSATVHAPVVTVGSHTLVDVNGGTLDPGDTVNVSISVNNTGAAGTAGTLSDTLSNLQNPTSIKLDGLACGACSSAATQVTAPFGTLGAGGSHIVTFSATVPGSPVGTTASSSTTITFSPATTGTSPTATNTSSLTIGSGSVQDWHVAISQQPPVSAQVGDIVTVKATISVDAGGQDLSVTSLASGAGTSGLDQVQFADSTPVQVNAGTSRVTIVSARVSGAPGAGGIHLQVSVGGTLGATSGTKTAATNTLVSTEAVTATLAAVPSTVSLGDQIVYTLTLTNASDTPAQLTGLPAGLSAPTGTTLANRLDGASTVPPNGTSTWTLTASVAASDTDGTVITQAPGAFAYAMSAIGLPSRAIVPTPANETSTVTVPPAPGPPGAPGGSSGSSSGSSASGSGTGGSSGTTTTTSTSGSADLALAVVAPATGLARHNVAYAFTLANHGPNTATGIELSTNFTSGGARLVSSSARCVHGVHLVCSLGSLGSGKSLKVTIVVRARGPAIYKNAAYVSGDQSDRVPANNSLVATTTVTKPTV